jgi:hypothetical protein
MDWRKYVCRMIGVLQQCSRQSDGDPCILELRVSFSGVKTLGLILIDCTWQWWLSSHFLVEDIVWRLDLLQGENLGSDNAG